LEGLMAEIEPVTAQQFIPSGAAFRAKVIV
jgi:hypothetical protein